MLQSHSFIYADFETEWYKRWAKALRQDKAHLEDYALHANKFWQNAVMVQALSERGVLVEGATGIGFGVGQERLPALFAQQGVKVMATDQDFATKKAGHWAEHELASGTQSLNKLNICDPRKFANNVAYAPMDMKKVPKKYHGHYNFLWSNCALGHLGSIDEGLRFIEESLQCLVPGGWAVHTTELNILSNDATVTEGNTVIFRLKDINRLQDRLIKQGYKASPLRLQLGSSPMDRRVSLAPQFGNDYSKIQFNGHLATQIVLIIQKPEHGGVNAPRQQAQRVASYSRNLLAVMRYKQTDPIIRPLLQSRTKPTSTIKVKPTTEHVKIRIKRGSTTQLRLVSRNRSRGVLLGVSTELTAKPLVLATAEPVNRDSPFADATWVAPNRPSATLLAKQSNGRYKPVEYVTPGQEFAFDLVLNAKRVKRGSYLEHFCLVQELAGWVADTVVAVTIEII